MLRVPEGGWARAAAAWLLALALLLGTVPPIPGALPAGVPDSFVAADLCSSTHGADPAQAGASGHDCGGHCCVLSGGALPTAPLDLLPLGVVVLEKRVPVPSPAPDEPPRTTHSARAPPFLVA